MKTEEVKKKAYDGWPLSQTITRVAVEVRMNMRWVKMNNCSSYLLETHCMLLMSSQYFFRYRNGMTAVRV